VYRLATIFALAVVVAGCGSPSASKNATVTPTVPGITSTATPAPTPVVEPTPKVVLAPAYLSFLHTVCHSLSAGDAAVVTAHLMHYQYNSGLRWGMFGDGEGTTSDPSEISTWFSGSHVVCQAVSSNIGGHGTLLTSGWARPAPWSLLDLDLLNGQWVINDFTFGSAARLARAMHQVAQPVVRYRR
jgi:hypothetical protein